MSKKDLVTIIIVNFNGGELLARSVRQAFTSNTPVKLIVSDNASTDNSIPLLEQEFGSDSRLTVIHNS
ncbi:MAG TPA: glycosyltransferase, partial [Gammaproteobacteria bacterium]|nr:glycosyltransferase [Gammaproteobacteria bacterium]